MRRQDDRQVLRLDGLPFARRAIFGPQRRRSLVPDDVADRLPAETAVLADVPVGCDRLNEGLLRRLFELADAGLIAAFLLRPARARLQLRTRIAGEEIDANG